MKKHDLQPRDVDEVHLYAGSNILNPLRYALPQTGLEGKFSLPSCLTSILLRRRAGIREFSDGFVKNPEVHQMMKRVKTILDPDIEAKGFAKILSRLEVRLRDGRVLTKESGPYKGGPEDPLSEAELEEKFTTCAEFVLPPDKISLALESIRQVGRLTNIQILIPTLLPD